MRLLEYIIFSFCSTLGVSRYSEDFCLEKGVNKLILTSVFSDSRWFFVKLQFYLFFLN